MASLSQVEHSEQDVDSAYNRFLRVVKPVSVVNGIEAPLYIKQEQVDEVVSNFQLEHSDIWITTYSKAGTTWTQQIVKLIRNRGESDGIKMDESVPWFEANGHFKVDLSSLPRPRAFKSHMPYHAMVLGEPSSTPCKYIYVARNPKDVAVSFYFHYLRLLVRSDAKLEWDLFFRNFINGKVLFGDFFDHVLGWWAHKDNKNVLFLTFEEMKRDLSGVVARITNFIEIDISAEVISQVSAKSTFDFMKEDKTVNHSWVSRGHAGNPGTTPFMRKGEVGDWKNYFTPEQSEEMDKICRERLEGTGLVFDFGDS